MSCKCKNIIENFQGGVVPLSTTFLSPVYFSGDTYHNASIFSGGTNLLDLFCTKPCGVSADTNTFVIGGNFSGTTLTLIKNNLSTVSITGFTHGGTFTGNTSGYCINDLWVKNVHGCSPITIHDNIKSPTGQIVHDISGFSFSYGTDVITKNSNSVAIGVNTSAGYYQPYSAKTGTVISGGTIVYSDDFGTYNLFFPGVDVEDEWQSFDVPPSTFVVFSGTSPITSFIVDDAEYSGTSGTWIYESDDEFWDNMGITAGTWTISGNTTSNVQPLIDNRYSFAGGDNSIAEGNVSFAYGYSARSEGDYSIAFGYNTVVKGDFGLAFGENTTSERNNSLVGGLSSIAGGSGSFAFGKSVFADGPNSVAFGNGTLADGTDSFACGRDTMAFGGRSFACGDSTQAGVNTADYGAFSCGRDTKVLDGYSFAGGRDATVDAKYSFIFSKDSLLTGERSVLLGGESMTGDTDDTVYVPKLNIGIPLTTTPSYHLGIDSNGFVVTAVTSVDTFVTGGTFSGTTLFLDKNDGQQVIITGFTASGGGSGTFTGNTLNSCITDLYVSDLYTCSGSSITTVHNSLTIDGHLAATSKSFEIDHPTKEGKKLIHGSLEGPEHGVYVRGELKDDNIIVLPDYWKGLVDENSITVQLTPIGRACIHYVDEITDYEVYVDCDDGLPHCYYFIQGERKDINKLQIEK